ncbi:MAG: hypothetical protein HOV83_19005 [Catenulispora sp.]|nr:hypothetical protein [Catenulispora sp.]
MNDIEHDAAVGGPIAEWRTALKDSGAVTVTYVVVALTNFGEHAIPHAPPRWTGASESAHR